MAEELRTVEDVIAQGAASNQLVAKKDILTDKASDDFLETGHITNVFDQSLAGIQDEAADIERLRDRDILEQGIEDTAKSGSDADKLKAQQELLRLSEFEQAIGTQLESEQLAQRTLFREQQANVRQQQQLQGQAQSASAQLQNRAAQSGFTSSATQGIMSSIGSQTAEGLGILGIAEQDLIDDQVRVASNLEDDLAFLNETFDLGGSIGAASQSIADRQAKEAQSAADRQELVSGISSGAALGASVGGPVGAGFGAVVGGLVTLF